MWWKLILLGVTLLGTYLWVTEGQTMDATEKWIIFALIVLHVYKYVWPTISQVLNKNKRNKTLQFYRSLSKQEKVVAERLWSMDEWWIENAEIKNLPTDFDTLRKELKKEVKKVNKERATNEKRGKDQRTRDLIAQNLARQKKEEEAKNRKEYLTNLYGAENAKKIINNQVWLGMSQEMLKESLGTPVKKQEQIHKQTVKNNLFYKPRRTQKGTEMPTFRVDLENGTVVGWKDLDPN